MSDVRNLMGPPTVNRRRCTRTGKSPLVYSHMIGINVIVDATEQNFYMDSFRIML